MMVKRMFTIKVDGLSFVHFADTVKDAERRAVKTAKRLGVRTYTVFEHKLTKVV